MDVRFVRAALKYLRVVDGAARCFVVMIVLILAPTALTALPVGARIGTGWMVMQTKYDIDSTAAYGENRPLVGIGVQLVVGALAAGVDAAFTASEPTAFVYGSDGSIDGLESGSYSAVIATERLSYLRFSIAVGHEFEIAAVDGVTLTPALELFGLRNLAYTSGATNLIETWPADAQEDVRKALDGVYVGVSGTLSYRISDTIAIGARIFAARAVTAKIFPSSLVRVPAGAEPRRNAWGEIGTSVTYTFRPSDR